ncbi:MAG: hypothetical protein NPIRA05_11570 [Nitrospirales bacterium]|nr:MAG: hypothetical protein NPIRA05_11570 [Nitrospirales bacterium]
MQQMYLYRFFVMCILVICLSSLGVVHAEEGRWTAGFNTGLSLLSQEAIEGTDGAIGPVLNAQVSYGLSSLLSAGFFVEWENRSFENESGNDIGSLNTISLMPMVIWHLEPSSSVFPYLSTAIGMNVNAFDEDSGVVDIDLDTTFAWRLAGGVNFPLETIKEGLMLNGEMAWKRNRGGVEVGNSNQNADASSINFLVGVRYTF